MPYYHVDSHNSRHFFAVTYHPKVVIQLYHVGSTFMNMYVCTLCNIFKYKNTKQTASTESVVDSRILQVTRGALRPSNECTATINEDVYV